MGHVTTVKSFPVSHHNRFMFRIMCAHSGLQLDGSLAVFHYIVGHTLSSNETAIFHYQRNVYNNLRKIRIILNHCSYR